MLHRALIAIAAMCQACLPAATGAADADRAILARVFGRAAEPDPARRARAMQAEPGVRLFFAPEAAGEHAEVWFVDADPRHPPAYRPVLVRAIDEDDDLAPGAEPDRDSDLYVADWRADGTVDALLDYTDTDGDNDLDEMGIFFTGSRLPYFDEPALRVWWGRDVGDDNLLWFDIAYTYDQALCQYRTHFGGDEMFVAFALPASAGEWIPCFENPFLFYDRDGDGVTEEVLRVSGVDRHVESIRHSFDADNDATPAKPRDFDVSITSWARGAHWTGSGRARGRSDLTLDDRFTERTAIRGIPTGPFLRHDAAPAFTSPVTWARTMLTWDEIDRNFDGQGLADAEERWEGVIAHGCADFPQVGGPSAGPVNKRYELDLAPSGPTRLYLHPADQRVHLAGADRAWLDLDVDLDRVPDLRYEMLDEDGDGFIDAWRLDLDADGTAEESWRSGAVPELLPDLGWSGLSARYRAALAESAAPIALLNDVLRQALDRSPHAARAGCPLPWAPGADASAESRFLKESVDRDVMIACLRRHHAAPRFWAEFDAARARGDLIEMSRLAAREFPLPAPPAAGEPPAPASAPAQPPRTAWAEDWVPPNIGWESETVAYRMYWGQFDFFGKKRPCLIYPTIGAVSYHQETDWGIDALLVGDSPGCGGVTLYVDGAPYRAWAPSGQGPVRFEKRMLRAEGDAVAVEAVARNVGPADSPYVIRWHCTALAGRDDSPIQLSIEGGLPGRRLDLGVGLSRLARESLLVDTAAGVLGVWGDQTPDIGAIGMGIIFTPSRFLRIETLPGEHQLVLAVEPNAPVTYHIECSWLRGYRFSCCPTAADWLERLRASAARIRTNAPAATAPQAAAQQDPAPRGAATP